MDPTERSHLIYSERLSNGIEIKCYNVSRPVAGDRWYVSIQINVLVPLKRILFDQAGLDEAAYREMVENFDKFYVVPYKKERNFIAENKVSKLTVELFRNFMVSSRQYIADPKFPPKALNKGYKELRDRLRWKNLHREAIKKAEKE